jgi:hypothetical protein
MENLSVNQPVMVNINKAITTKHGNDPIITPLLYLPRNNK